MQMQKPPRASTANKRGQYQATDPLNQGYSNNYEEPVKKISKAYTHGSKSDSKTPLRGARDFIERQYLIVLW